MVTAVLFFAMVCQESRVAILREASSQASCRIQWRARVDGKAESVCLSENLWRQWPAGSCALVSGRWKSTRSALLDLQQKSSSPDVFRRFQIRAIAQEGSPVPGLWTVFRSLDEWRLRVSRALTPSDPTGVFRRLILDERPENRFIEEDLRQKGWVHHFSAAGIHLYALLGLAMAFFEQMFFRQAMQVEKARFLARFFSGILGFTAWALSGFRWGWMRPFAVLLIRQFLVQRGIRIRWWIPLILALVVEEFFFRFSDQPSSILMGRTHYALAVGGGLAAIEASRRRWMHPFSMAIGSWWATTLWDLWVDSHASLWTPLISLLTVSMMVFLFYPLALGWVLLGVKDPAIIRSFSDVLEKISSSQTRLIEMGFPLGIHASREALVFGFLLSVLLLHRLRSGLSRCVVLLFLLIWAGIQEHPGSLQVSQWDVGQGDAAWVRSDQQGLIDVGASRFGPPASRWASALGRNRIHHLDWVLLTHLDDDHAGGLSTGLAKISIGCVVSAEAQWKSERGRKLQAQLEARGTRVRSTEEEKIRPSCIPFPLLGPTPGKVARANQAMTGILIPLSGNRFYLNLGDADDRQESFFAAELYRTPEFARARDPQITLKLSHHGSKHSSAENFLKKLRPKEAWVSSGMGNHYGHPHADVLEKLRRLKIPLKRTDAEGALVIHD